MHLAILNTGGTISCIGQPLAPMGAAAFAQASMAQLNPALLAQHPDVQLSYLTELAFPDSASGTLDSTNLQPRDWCLIAEVILRHYTDYDGWVILHGTDTLDATAAALPFLLSRFSADGFALAALSRPIILTGSQLPLWQQSADGQLMLHPYSDALQNLSGAVAAAQSGLTGVGVFFNRQLWPASRVRKVHSAQFAAFAAPNAPALGQYGIQPQLHAAHWPAAPASPAISLEQPTVRQALRAQLAAVQARLPQVPVTLFSAFPATFNPALGQAWLADMFCAGLALGVKGVVLQGYGAGSFPSGHPQQPAAGAMYQALQQAQAQGVLVVGCTQTLQGGVAQHSYAAGAWQAEVGVLNPADLTPMAALVKLSLLLAMQAHHGWSLATVKRLFQQNLLGEMHSVNRLDSRSQPGLLPGQALTALDGSAECVNHPQHGLQLWQRQPGQPRQLCWQALAADALAQARLPLRLTLHQDGVLQLSDGQGQSVWQRGGDPRTHAAVLSLDGSAGEGNLTLRVCDAASGQLAWQLYPESPPAPDASPTST